MGKNTVKKTKREGRDWLRWSIVVGLIYIIGTLLNLSYEQGYFEKPVPIVVGIYVLYLLVKTSKEFS